MGAPVIDLHDAVLEGVTRRTGVLAIQLRGVTSYDVEHGTALRFDATVVLRDPEHDPVLPVGAKLDRGTIVLRDGSRTEDWALLRAPTPVRELVLVTIDPSGELPLMGSRAELRIDSEPRPARAPRTR